MTPRIHTLFFTSLLVLFAGCSKAPLQLKPLSNSSADWRAMGFDAGRTSAVEETLALPLVEIAKFKFSSAVSQNVVISRGLMFVPTLDGRLYMVDLEKHEIVRKKKLPQGNAGTLAATPNSIMIALRFGKNTLYHYDIVTNKQLWGIDAGDIASEPLISDSVVFITALYQHVDAYHLKDGQRRWQFKTTGQLHASPVLSEGILVVAASDGKIYGLRAETGKKIWETDLQQPILATPAVHRQRVFVGTARNQLAALNLLNGAVIWRTASEGRVFHSPAVNDSLVVFGCADGRLRAFVPESGRLKWESRALSVIGTAPLLAGDKVFFGALDRHLYALRAHDGDLMWRQELRGRVRTNPILWNNQLIVACEDRDLYIFGQSPNDGQNPEVFGN